MRERDLTPEQTRAIIERVGCRVAKRIDLYDGATAFEVTCRTHAQKVELLRELAEADADLPDVRRIAERVVAGSQSDAERATRLHAFVRDLVSFTKEKREIFSPTLHTLEVGLGDCDDSARALLALLRSLDLPARLKTLPEGGPEPLHVAAQVQLGGQWHWLETSIDAEAGEHPLQAAKRLGIAARPELGDAATLEGGPLWAFSDWLALALAGTLLAGGLWWMSARN